jgi:hypothetical protein
MNRHELHFHPSLKKPDSMGIFFLLVVIACACSFPDGPRARSQAEDGQISSLSGKEGELGAPAGRLHDYSAAGYRGGASPLPFVAVVASVKDFGAVGDGKTDDSRAFQSAVQSVQQGAILIPRGRYRITRPVILNKPEIVLRGEDRHETVLLAAHVPGDCSKTTQGPPNCAPYGGAAMLQIAGQVSGRRLATVVRSARRGNRALRLSSARSIRAGHFIRLRMRNPSDNSLGCHLYMNAGCLNAERRKWYAGRIVDWVVEVETVEGDIIVLARPLRLDVRAEWQPEIWSFDPTVQKSGIENLTIQFSGDAYAGHNDEQGHYAILVKDAYNCWVRDVTIVDADRGIEVSGGYNTIRNVSLRASARRSIRTAGVDATGHFGFSAGGPHAQDNLFADSQLETVFVHNLSVSSFANGNVFSRITSQAAHLDHHAGAPYENLFTEIAITDDASGLFMSGGNRANEPNGARTTVWNLTYKGAFSMGLAQEKLPGLNIVGVEGLAAAKPDNEVDWWIEPSSGSRIPKNLYEAQSASRTRENEIPRKPY